MVYGIAFCPSKESELLTSFECADSKVLTEEKRDNIFSKLCNVNTIGWGVEIISPNIICNNMLNPSKVSLNDISMNSAIGLIKAVIAAGVNVDHIYLDTVGKPEKYQAYLMTIFPNYKITVAKKADSTYPIVSAASICAKVTRDHALQQWKFIEDLNATNKDFGSGYPGGNLNFTVFFCISYSKHFCWVIFINEILFILDPVTKKFLTEYCDPVFGFPQLVRFSWSTASNALEETAYHVDWAEVEDESAVSKNNASITSFFKSNKNPVKSRHPFFMERCLSSTTMLWFFFNNWIKNENIFFCFQIIDQISKYLFGKQFLNYAIDKKLDLPRKCRSF